MNWGGVLVQGVKGKMGDVHRVPMMITSPAGMSKADWDVFWTTTGGPLRGSPPLHLLPADKSQGVRFMGRYAVRMADGVAGDDKEKPLRVARVGITWPCSRQRDGC